MIADLICDKNKNWLIVFKRNYHFKRRNGYFEDFFGAQVFHLVRAVHAAHFSTQIAAAYILVFFTGVKRWLNTYNAFTFYFAVLAIAVKNLPMAAVQLYGKIIFIFYGDAVGKHKLRLQRIGVVWLVESFYTYFNAF